MSVFNIVSAIDTGLLKALRANYSPEITESSVDFCVVVTYYKRIDELSKPKGIVGEVEEGSGYGKMERTGEIVKMIAKAKLVNRTAFDGPLTGEPQSVPALE
jgi:hypothetical protein